jgi:SNF2 family DNA or RNA helicase
MDELGDKKLVVFTNYRMTNELLKAHTAAKYNGRVLYGGMVHKQQQAALDTFVDDPSCRVLTLQIQAGGMGIDNLQSVCSDVLFLEFPTVPAHVYQALSRIHRDGQKEKVNVRIAIAEKTLQVRKFETLMDNDQLVNRVIRNIADLRAAIFGN